MIQWDTLSFGEWVLFVLEKVKGAKVKVGGARYALNTGVGR